ncbi:hypothetical protein ACM66B_000100 [Microbotryomycetes sp. NB124-2]
MHSTRDTCSSRWASPPQPTRFTGPANDQDDAASRSRWRTTSATHTSSSASSITSQGGLRRARDDIGRKPQQLDMLLSPSRGIQGDSQPRQVNLLDTAVQEQFRKHIQTKWHKVEQAWPEQPLAPLSDKRRHELGIVLLDFRKLREGLTAARRQDAFAAEVYESSALCAIKAENWQQLGSCLPHLVHVLHPTLSPASSLTVDTSVNKSDLSEVTETLSQIRIGNDSDRSPRNRQMFFISLYLLNTLLHDPLPFPAYHEARQSLSHVLNKDFDNSSPHIHFVDYVYHALLESNYVRLSRLFQQTENTPTTLVDEWDQEKERDELVVKPNEYQLQLLSSCLPKVRAHTVQVLGKAYKMKSDFNGDPSWLDRCLVMGDGCRYSSLDPKDKTELLDMVVK